MKRLSVLDLFSGCGGLSLGFHRAGFTIVGGLDSDQRSAQTHACNFFANAGDEVIERQSKPLDITELQPEQYLRHIFLDKQRGSKSDSLVDVIMGGPPCQAFSRIGRAKLRDIMDHPDAYLKDLRSSYYLNFLEYVEYFRPRAVVMENVVEIMNYGGTNVAEEIAISLENMGYETRYTILNAVHYGVPQIRQRFFLMAFLQGLGATPAFPRCTHYFRPTGGYKSARGMALKAIGPPTLFDRRFPHYIDPPISTADLPPAITVSEALCDLPPIDVQNIQLGPRSFNTLSLYSENMLPSGFALQMRSWPGFESTSGVCDHVTRYLPRDFPIFMAMQPGDRYPEAHYIAERRLVDALEIYRIETGHEPAEGSDLYLEMRSQIVPPYDPSKFVDKWQKLQPEAPSHTLTAHIGHDTYSHIHYDSDQGRVISVREAARLQSFPDGFIFAGAMNSAFRQIGNAVPPLLAYALACGLREVLWSGNTKYVC